MIALGAHLLATVAVAAVPAPARAAADRAALVEPAPFEPVASTYDQAACDPSDSGECADDEAPAFPAAPAVLDCNDARLSVYIAEMIGSCDMPHPAPLAKTASLRKANAPAPARVCDGLCAPDSQPIRPAPRGTDDGSPLAGTLAALTLPSPASALHVASTVQRDRIIASRLDRPPRA